MKLGTEEGLDPGNIALDGDSAPPEKDTATPKYSAHVYHGQIAGCITIPLGTEWKQALAQVTLC